MSDKTYTSVEEFFKDHVATEIAQPPKTTSKALKYLREAARRRHGDNN